MDFKDNVLAISERVKKLKDNLQTEEATKNALIMPFINALGYDVFNPLEVVPEMICDIGSKKGEKIDYAILKDEKPIILIECKHWQQDLNLHNNQLLRYFNVSNAKFGVLTNGIIYKFYSDLEKPNVMDEKPFLEVNLLDIKESQIEELKKFHKSYFDIGTILSSASELKYMSEFKTVISKEFANPSPEFVKLLGKQVYTGQFQQKIIEQFSSLLKRAISLYINDIISDRLKKAIPTEEENKSNIETNDNISENDTSQKIVTTDSEIQAFYIIKSILRLVVSPDRIVLKDAVSYCPLFLDGNNRKLICQLHFNNEENKRIVLLDENKNKIVQKIESLDDIYLISDQLIEIVNRYL